jgi:23S rRNA (adenine2503-C2)-methyltransferase
MGMGEPLLNLNPVLDAAERIHKLFNIAYVHITISTSCLRNIEKLLDVPFNVALSVHSVFDKTRKKIMPASISIKKIVDFAEIYCKKHPRKELMIEYTLMNGINDTEQDLKKLSSLHWPKKTLFNFIQCNDLGDYVRSEHQRLYDFKQTMILAGYKSFVRLSRGNDIGAACGMLDSH